MSIYNNANVGSFGTNPDDIESINDAAHYADKSREWAISPELVDDGTNPLDYSSRTWAEMAKEYVDSLPDDVIIGDAPINGQEYSRKDASWIISSVGEALSWGGIGGTLSDQLDLQSELDLIQSQIDSIIGGISLRGPATVAELNAMGILVTLNYSYKLTDAGTLTQGSVVVVVGDNVIWDGAVWINLGQETPGIEEAPQDGKQYARQDGSWTEIVESGGGEAFAIGGLYLSLTGNTPDVDLGYGVWSLISGDATLSLGSGGIYSGTVAGSNTQVPTLLTHTHANTASGAAHTHTGAAHGHSATFAGSSHSHIGGAPTSISIGAAYGTHVGASLNDFASSSAGYKTNYIKTSSTTTGGSVTVNSGGDGPTGGASATTVTMSNQSSGDGAEMNIRSAYVQVNVYKRTA
jgi:hypothetical protein